MCVELSLVKKANPKIIRVSNPSFQPLVHGQGYFGRHRPWYLYAADGTNRWG